MSDTADPFDVYGNHARWAAEDLDSASTGRSNHEHDQFFLARAQVHATLALAAATVAVAAAS